MIEKIDAWIDLTNESFISKRQSCVLFARQFAGFYSEEFLANSYFVIVDSIPMPDFPELRQLGVDDFFDMDIRGITYKDTYYILPSFAKELRLHFHELVHVAQWKTLGAVGFLQRYIKEIQKFGYSDAPLEKSAYKLDRNFTQGKEKFDVPSYVESELKNIYESDN